MHIGFGSKPWLYHIISLIFRLWSWRCFVTMCGGLSGPFQINWIWQMHGYGCMDCWWMDGPDALTAKGLHRLGYTEELEVFFCLCLWCLLDVPHRFACVLPSSFSFSFLLLCVLPSFSLAISLLPCSVFVCFCFCFCPHLLEFACSHSCLFAGLLVCSFLGHWVGLFDC